MDPLLKPFLSRTYLEASFSIRLAVGNLVRMATLASKHQHQDVIRGLSANSRALETES